MEAKSTPIVFQEVVSILQNQALHEKVAIFIRNVIYGTKHITVYGKHRQHLLWEKDYFSRTQAKPQLLNLDAKFDHNSFKKAGMFAFIYQILEGISQARACVHGTSCLKHL